ncbi:MAG: hypothetical protein WB511_07360 [Nitrososphaeraceae archaeon]
MNIFGRIVLCGTTSQYNDPSASDSSMGPSNLSLAVSHRLRLQGFILSDHTEILNEFNANMSKWINEGKVRWKENIFEGLENTPKAFVSLFKGETIGRSLVKIGAT